MQQWVKKKETPLGFRAVSQQAEKNSVSRSRHNPGSGELTITSLSGKHTWGGMNDAVWSSSPMPIDALLLLISRGPVLDFL